MSVRIGEKEWDVYLAICYGMRHQRQISERLGLKRMTTTRAILELEACGLVRLTRVAGRMSRKEKKPIAISGYSGIVEVSSNARIVTRELKDGLLPFQGLGSFSLSDEEHEAVRKTKRSLRRSKFYDYEEDN